jgi:Protein of unknown function (DUF3489)
MNTDIITSAATSSAAEQTTPKRKRAGKGKPAKQTAKAKTRKKAGKLPKAKSKLREGSKTAMVLELLRRKDGATIGEIATVTNWQNHSIRGFISGTITKKMGCVVESAKNDAGERSYRIGE